jgi:cellulose synthase/poly-beta-1,6-N-acetylglucosamine synthase-like glycosyltransferase
MLKLLFWILTGIIFYAYFGYTLILLFAALFKQKKKFNPVSDNDLPKVTLLIAAYNEKDIISLKLKNSFELNYPEDKLTHLWITDGSDDGTYDLLKQRQKIVLLHQAERAGKTAALNRAMKHVKTPITVFTDANTMLHPDTIHNLVRWFDDNKTGCVAGEKKIFSSQKETAASAGEGIYWSYESLIKKLESKVGFVMGAAGELYAIRTELYNPPADNVILDDFMVSMSIAEKGYRFYYEPKAFASENSSFNIQEELKRKIRIAAGGFQLFFNKLSLLNFFNHFVLSFQYISHKVLRWILAPFSLIAIFIINLFLFLDEQTSNLYSYFFYAQVLFYFLGFLGFILRNKLTRFKFLFAPFYLIVMNYSIIVGLFRYFKGNQNAAWEKVKRSEK